MDHQPLKQFDHDSNLRREDKRHSADEQSFFLDPEDDIDPATRDRDGRPRVRTVGCGMFGFVFAVGVAVLVLRAQAERPSPWWFVGLLLLFTPIFGYLLNWLIFVHPYQIDEKLKAEKAARGANRPRDGGPSGSNDD